jgi:hypothetical protein
MAAPDPPALPDAYVRRTIATELAPEEVAALVAWYEVLSAAVARFPADDLRRTEPPLRSVPR